MNSRQRRGVILLALSVVCAVAAFAGVVAVVNDAESKAGNEVTAYELRREVPAYQRLSRSDFKQVRIPERWLPDTAVRDLAGIGDRVAATRLEKGSLLQSDMAVERPALRRGQREIAIMVDAETGVAGKINVGDRVDIFATFDSESRGGRDRSSRIIVSNALVIDAGEMKHLRLNPEDDDARDALPVTFALSPADAQRVAYAESFATHVRLALVAPDDDTVLGPDERTYTLDEDQ